MFACLPARLVHYPHSPSPLYLSGNFIQRFSASSARLPLLLPVCVRVTNNVEIKCYARGDKRRLSVVVAAAAVEATLMQLATTPPNR